LSALDGLSPQWVRYHQIHQVFQHMAECITAPLPTREAAFPTLGPFILVTPSTQTR
jgi:hypothetical protein